ncbi:MAG: hypothetical protein KGH75_07970 [Rhodospirillales bacterium]|nr:hypothetical protein [Rhodospirillales bacterium]
MENLIRSAIVASMIGFGGVAFAAAPALPIRGTIDTVQGRTLSVTETSGTKITVTLTPHAAIAEVVPSSLAAVKAGSYVGTAAVQQMGGTYRAMELQIFPEKMRGIGLGTRQWNLAPHSTMTNGTVGGMANAGGTVGTVSGSGDLTLTVNDGSGTKTVLVPQGVPVVTYAPGYLTDLQPGAHVILFPSGAVTNGAVTTSRIGVGKDGLTPPM